MKTIDDNVPAFNEWNDSAEKLIVVSGISADEPESNEDLPSEYPPSLAESLEYVRRLRLLSTTQQPELHAFITQLQSKLIDALLDSSTSTQRSIFDYFKRIPVPHSGNPGKAQVLFF